MKFRDYSNYEVYEDGRIWSYNTNRFLKPQTTRGGYQQVKLYDNEGKMKLYYLHRVVYESVTGEPIPNGLQCNHISEDKMDCSFENLNLMTPKENNNWGTRTERASKALKGIIPKANPPKQVGAFQNDELIMVFPSTREAGRQGFNQGNVSSCCIGKLQHYKGYTWKYI